MIVRESLWITRHMYIDYVSSKAPSSVEEVMIYTIHKFLFGDKLHNKV